MSRKGDALREAGRVGEDVVRARLATYLGGAAAILAGCLTLVVLVALALIGTGPGLVGSVLLIPVVALLAGLVARAATRRLSVAAIAAFAARRVARRRGR